MEMEEPERKLSPFDAVPEEIIKAHIIPTIHSQSGSLTETAQSINAFSRVKKEFHRWANDTQVTNNIIAQLEAKFDANFITFNPLLNTVNPLLNKIYLLALLATPGARTVLNQQYISDPNTKKEAEKFALLLIQRKQLTKENRIILHSLIKTDIDVNSKDNESYTLLHWGAIRGHQAPVEALLGRSDIEVNSETIFCDPLCSHHGPCFGFTPIRYAATYKHPEIVKSLLEHPKIKINSKAFY